MKQTNTHRDMYPEQYSHHFVGKQVKVIHSGEVFTVKRVASTRFGLMCVVDGDESRGYLAVDCEAID